MELKTLVFEKAGPHNTAVTLQIALKRALALGIQQVVLASSYGDTARQAHALFAPEGVRGSPSPSAIIASNKDDDLRLFDGVHGLAQLEKVEPA